MDGCIELSEIEDCLADRRKRLRFSPRLERDYQSSVSRHRALAMRSSIAPFVFTYNILVTVDLLLLPQTLWLALILHLGVLTPLMLACGLIRPNTSLVARETLAASVAVGMVAQVMTIYLMNTDPARDQYQYLAIFILVNMNVNQRLDYRYARVVSGLIGLLYAAALILGRSPLAVQVVGITSMAAAAFVTLSANERMEKDMRFAFLKRAQDRSHREKAELEAVRDALTTLFNRRYLERYSEKFLFDRTTRTAPLAVLMIDVDHFKAFNDRYGHLAGDLCLKRIAGAITAELRNEHDAAVRYGGEEFLVLLPTTESREATRVAERMRRMIQRLAIPHEDGGKLGVVTASVGVVAEPMSTHELDELITAADAALYAAKRNGRNTVWPPLLANSRTAPKPEAARATV